ncbi:MAG: hypothetical protein QOG23_5716 [Blastocatellia bacterium]|nr:hypothetical protein [Blastocatellia bacterium]
MKRSFILFLLTLSVISVSHAQSPVTTVVSATPGPSPAVASSAGATAEPVAAGADSAASDVAAPVPPLEKSIVQMAVRFKKPPVIDGRLDDEAWKHALLLGDFHQIQPGDNIAPSKPTEMLLGFDDKFLYIAFRAHDDPRQVRATVAKRDDVADDDNVRVLLDTYNDQRKAYILIFNPLGVQQDGILTEGGDEDYSVDIVMESKGVLTNDGYTVEVAIPFKSLRYLAGKDKLWGLHAFRRIKRFNNESDSWMPISRNKSGLLNQGGHLGGLESLSKERTLEIIPSLTLSETGRRARTFTPTNPLVPDPGRLLNEPIKQELGVTMKLTLASNLVLDFAYNPDFAQVEADQPVVTANQRFPIFFEEKRPIFLEGIDIFQTPLTAVHTRAIIDPDYVVKLTGKRGRNTFGLLLASDNGPGNFSDEELLDSNNLRFLDKNAYIGVLRLKHDIGKESNIGLIATSYNFVENHNQLAGIDGRFRIDAQTVFNFQVLGTYTRTQFFDADAGKVVYDTRGGLGYFLNYEHTGRHWDYRATGQGRTRDYRAAVGFTSRTNTNLGDFFVQYRSEPKPKAKLISWRVYNSFRPRFDWQGRSQGWQNEFQAAINLRRQTTLGIGLNPGYERLFEEEFGPKRNSSQQGAFFGPDPERSSYKKSAYVFATSTPTKKYSFFVFGGYTSGAFDFDFGAGPRFPRVSPAALANPSAPLDPGPGNLLELNGTFKYKPTDALTLSLDYTKSKLTRNDTGRVAFDENIYTLRSTYQFTRFVFARARVDYDSLASRVFGQFLVGWAPNPGTSFYIGYNDDMNRNGFNPFTGQLEPGFERNRRTFFVKMSYLFRRGF